MYYCLLFWIALLHNPLAGLAISRSKHFRPSLAKTVGRLHKRNHKTPHMKLISGFTFRQSSQTPAFKFQPPLGDSTALNTLRNKKIVFIGDSITRYQYLNLVYFLERGHFPQPFCTDEKLPQSVCCQRNVGSSKDITWNSFFQSTNEGLHGNEICDCVRKKHFNLENRIYHNKEHNSLVAFFWLGRDLGINLRASMFTHPLQPACLLQTNEDTQRDTNRSCHNIAFAASQFDNVTLIGDAIRNITVSVNPDMMLMNWGHHTMYKWQKGLGRLQYESITHAIQQLRVDKYQTLFYWKTTTPIYSCENNLLPGNENMMTPRCRLKLMTEVDGQNPIKLGSKLVKDGLLENFDAQHYIKLLHMEVRRRHLRLSRHHQHPLLPFHKKPFPPREEEVIINATSSCIPIASPTAATDASISTSTSTSTSSNNNNNNYLCHKENNPLGWDSLHYYCWVNTELNRALISSYKLKMKKE